MLHLFRRHRTACSHRSLTYRRCQCPIYVQGRLGNETIRESLNLTSWEAASQLIAEWTRAGKIRPIGSAEKPVADAVRAFIDDGRTRGLQPATLAKYTNMLERRLVAWCTANGYEYLPSLTLDAMTRFRATWPGEALSKSKTQERLRTFFKWCVARKWISDNPATGLSSFRVKHEPTLPFTRDEYERILAACDAYSIKGKYGASSPARIKAMVLLLRWTGLRIRDAVTITRQRVADRKVDLYTQKTGQHVHVPVPAFVTTALEAVRGHGDRLFWTGNGLAKSAVADWQRSLRRVFTLAKVEGGHAHRFRDTFAVELLNEGVELADVSILLGHSSIRITERHYAPWVRSRQLRLEGIVARTFNEPPASESVNHPARVAPSLATALGRASIAERGTRAQRPISGRAASGERALLLVRGGKAG